MWGRCSAEIPVPVSSTRELNARMGRGGWLDRDGDGAAGGGGVDGIGDEVGDDLHDLAFTEEEIRRWGEVAFDANAGGGAFGLVDADRLCCDVR